MGVYIKGVEMPTDHPMWIIVHSNGTVETNEISQARPFGWKTLRNAAVPVPPHGRLIDADALCEGRVSNDNVVICAKCAPTIVPAEEGK